MTENYMIRVRRDDQEERAAVAEAAQTVLADYGHSLLVRLEADSAESLAADGYRCKRIPQPRQLEIGAYAIDASAAEEASPGLLAADGLAPTEPELFLLRLAGPMHPDWKQGMESLGVAIHQREAANHYLIRSERGAVDLLGGLDYVESVQPYHPMLKLNQALVAAGIADSADTPAFMSLRLEAQPTVEESADELPGLLSSAPAIASPDHGANLEISLFGSDQRDAAVARLENAGVEIVSAEGDTILVAASRQQIPALASIVEIRQIDPYYPPTLANNVAAGIINTQRLRNDLELDGSGQVVAVADTGIDTGDAQSVLADFNGRVAQAHIHALGRPGDASDPQGHGTHVAGSILGNGALSNGTIQGMAPAATLVFQSVLDAGGGLGGLPGDLRTLFSQARQDGAHLHNNSWGRRQSNGAYLTNAGHADDFAFENRDFLILFAAGNDGPSFRVSSPGSAKNVLTVGASESLRQLPTSVSFPSSPRFPGGPSLSNLDQQADDANDVADFSCPGPVAQNRRKPDVVAPGTWILSCRSSDAEADTGPDGLAGLPTTPLFPDGGTGDEDGIRTHAEAVGRGLPGRAILGAGDVDTPPPPVGAGPDAVENYMYDSGTSMACPITAGAVALVRQFLVEQLQHTPSAALLKALMVNGAVDIAAGVPDPRQGWGRIDLESTLFAGDGDGLHFDDTLDHALETAEAHRWEAVPLDPDAPLSVTLVWRDPQGSALQNPLHLLVRHDGSGDEFVSDDEADVRNNVQKVIVEPRQAEERWIIEVEALDVSRGIRELAPEERQDFALVVANTQGLVLIE